MKTLPRTVKGAIVAVIAVLTSVTVLTRAQSPASEPDRDFVLKIKKERHYKTTEKAFNDALDGVTSEAIYQFKEKADDGKEQMKESKKVSLKTEKVTTSNLAKSGTTGEFTAIGAHVTIQIATNSVEDIKKVLDQLQ